jgi:protein involved in polysaccharide export with SLBB domain
MNCISRSGSARTRRAWLSLLTLAAVLVPGCAAVTNPLADSLPVRHLPPELLLTCLKDREESVPLVLLEQPPAETYRLDAGDVLGIWIDGILGDQKLPIPVHTPVLATQREQRSMPPSAGFPLTVQEDGALRLPYLEALPVRGLTLSQAEDAIRTAYQHKKLLPEGGAKLLVTLLQKRYYEVIVLRQEANAFTVGPEGAAAPAGRRGAGHILNLTAYENDVLHALAATGGLPGLDAYNQVVVYRRVAPHLTDRKALLQQLEQLPPGAPLPAELSRAPMVRIPLRQDPRLPVPFKPEDVLLETGDVVYLEARDKDVYYTSGLLPAGEHILPRDRDLDVLTAVSLVRGPLVNGTFGAGALSGLIFPLGIGQPSASLLVVLRRTADGGQLPIRVDLNRAMRDPRERILVHAGDMLILQERPTEALARYATQTFANFNLIWAPIQTQNATGIFDFMALDRQPGRGLFSTFQPEIQGQLPASPLGP